MPCGEIHEDGHVEIRHEIENEILELVLLGPIEWVEALASAGAPDLDELLAAFRSAFQHVRRHASTLEAALT